MLGFPDSSGGKESTCNVGDLGSIPGLEDPWRREWLPTPVFWSGEFHGLCSPWGLTKSQTRLSDFHFHLLLMVLKFSPALKQPCGPANPIRTHFLQELNKKKFRGSDSKESACNAGDSGSIPGSGRSPGEGNPLQCSCLENLMDREAWWATIHGVTKSHTQLSN